jgi:hypothetical protein
MNHLAAEIMIGAPAYSAEPRFASNRILARHKANPRRKFSPRAKMMTVVDRCDERRRDYRADARQLRQPSAGFVRPANLQELLI